MGLNTAILLTERAPLSESPSWKAGCIGAHRSALPLLVRFGITTEQEADVDTYAQRLREELVGLQSNVVVPHMVGAWVHIA